MIYKGNEIKGSFTHVCDNGVDADEFTIFANIIEKKEHGYLIERYQRFGNLKLDTVCLSEEMFKNYYREIDMREFMLEENDDEYADFAK